MCHLRRNRRLHIPKIRDLKILSFIIRSLRVILSPATIEHLKFR